MLRQPVDLEIGMALAEGIGDGYVAAGVSEPNRRGDEQGTFAARLSTGPRTPFRLGRVDAFDEFSQEEIEADRIAPIRCMAGALEEHQFGPERRGERDSRRRRNDGIVGAMNDESRAADIWRQREHFGLVTGYGPVRVSAKVAGDVSSAQVTQSSIALLECGSQKTWVQNHVANPG